MPITWAPSAVNDAAARYVLERFALYDPDLPWYYIVGQLKLSAQAFLSIGIPHRNYEEVAVSCRLVKECLVLAGRTFKLGPAQARGVIVAMSIMEALEKKANGTDFMALVHIVEGNDPDGLMRMALDEGREDKPPTFKQEVDRRIAEVQKRQREEELLAGLAKKGLPK
jgi:hypothetical protein